MILSVDNSSRKLSTKQGGLPIPTLHPSKEQFMREEFYQQVREFGILLHSSYLQEEWLIKGITITFVFSDVTHNKVDSITL